MSTEATAPRPRKRAAPRKAQAAVETGMALLPAAGGKLRAPGRALVPGSAEAGVLDRARAQLLVADWAGMVQQNDGALEHFYRQIDAKIVPHIAQSG